jgi:membrane protease YdiL (CAAX protease family)
MSGTVPWVRQHRMPAFFALAYLLSWAPWPLAAAGVLPEEISFFPGGPLLAALVVIALADGRRGYRRLLARLVRWRVGWIWYAVALGLPVALVLVTGLVTTWFGAPAPDLAGIAWADVALMFVIRLVDVTDGAAGEEPGWRGYALPHLQRRFSPLVAAGVLGVLVAGWHLPLVVLGSLSWVGLPGTVAITFVYVWLFDHTDGSLLLALLFHASQGAFTFGMLGLPAADAERAAAVYTGVLIVVVAGLVALDRRAWRSAPASAVEAEHGHERVPAGPSVAG